MLTESLSPTIPDRSLERRASVAGAAAAAVALGVGELVSALAPGDQSLVVGVGNEVVDRAAGGVVKIAIELFGTADKAVLVVTIVVLSLALGALLGRLSLRRGWVGPVGFAVFGLVGLLAGTRDPLSSDGWVLTASVAAVASGSLTLWVLLRMAADDQVLPMATTRSVETPGDGRATRRAFFGWAGAAGAFGATAALAARSLRDRPAVEQARSLVQLPTPATSSATTPQIAVADLGVEGITPYLVPNDRFYRIDTALIVPQVDPTTWTLGITGMVDRPFEIGFDELLSMATVEEAVTLSCVSNEVGGDLVGNALWQGVPLRDLLERAGVQPEGTQIVGTSVDDFTVGFPTEAAFDGRTALVAVGMNREPLPIRHGFPARLVVAGLYGYVSATKWLREIRLTGWDDFDAYWIPRGWSKEAPVKTQSRIDVPTSGSSLSPGTVAVAGVAWAPERGISRVEVQVDDGPWSDAELGDALSGNTWRQWLWRWDATPGTYLLRVRATDGEGRTQTEDRAAPRPDGATGWHSRRVTISG